MTEQIRIRKFEAHDLPAVVQLFDEYRQFYKEDSNYKLAEQFIRTRMENEESIILVAENIDGTLNGFCQLYPTFCSLLAKPIYILSDLFVSERARRHGIAKKLMRAAEQQSKKDGKARVDLTTAKTNLKAQALYMSQGWVRDEVYYTYNFNLPD